jgi:hypothetical protein
VQDGHLWPACQASLREADAFRIAAESYRFLSAAWDRSPLAEFEREGTDRIDEQVDRARKLVAAAALAAAARAEAPLGELCRWALLAAGNAGPSLVELPPFNSPGAERADVSPVAGADAGTIEGRIRSCIRVLHRERPELAAALAAAQDASLSLVWSVLSESERPLGPKVQMPLLLARDEAGYVASLWLQRVPGGLGQLYQAPCTTMDPVLPDLQCAIQAACRVAVPALPEGEDIRWWLSGQPRDGGRPLPVGGSSAAASAAVGLSHLLHRRPIRARCAITATVLSDGRLGAVDGLQGAAPKLIAARSLAGTNEPALVIVGPGSQLSAPSAAHWLAQGVQVVVAHTLADAERLSGLTAGAPRAVVRSDHRPVQAAPASPRVTVLYARTTEADRQARLHLVRALQQQGIEVSPEWSGDLDEQWAREMDDRLREADAAVVLLTSKATCSEMLTYEVQLAQEAAQVSGRPRLVLLRTDPSIDAELLPRAAQAAGILDWVPGPDTPLPAALLEAIRQPPAAAPARDRSLLLPPTGVLPLESPYYLERSVDEEFHAALRRRDSIIRIKGARQMGKTSLLARGLQQARETSTVLLTDFQVLNQAHFESIDVFLKSLAHWLVRQAGIDLDPEEIWDARQGSSVNFRDLMLELLEHLPGPVVWGLDEVDRLFTCSFHSEFFGLLRSFHNDRALHPSLPWSRLTITLCYATEAQLFLADLNQSPFNVGTRIPLDDFTPEEVSELNLRYGVPLAQPGELAEYYELFAGQPFLTHRGFHELETRQIGSAELRRLALREEGLFGDHLRRMLLLLMRDPELLHAVRELLAGRACPTAASFYRLWSGGVVVGDSAQDARFRCRLYAIYLERHLR